MRTPVPLLLFTAILALPIQSAGAGDDSSGRARFIRAAKFAADKVAPNSRVRVLGKYKELINDELYLFDCTTAFRLKSLELSRQLLRGVRKCQNVYIDAKLEVDAGIRTLEVIGIELAPDDFTTYSKAFAAERERIDGMNLNTVFKLGRRLVAVHSRCGDRRLLGLAKECFHAAICTRQGSEKLDEAEAIKRLTLAQSLVRLFPKSGFPTEIVLELEAMSPDLPEIHAFLRRRNCRLYQGQWVTYDEFKSREGFIQTKDGWITPAEKHLDESLEAFQRRRVTMLLQRRRTDREYRLLASQGKVEEGMRRDEVALAIGFPDAVLRRAFERKEFDQWQFGTQYYYFYDGLLVEMPKRRRARRR